jgi:hypothetical protein
MIPQGLINTGDRKIQPLDTSSITKQLVMGHLKNESISWVYDELLEYVTSGGSGKSLKGLGLNFRLTGVVSIFSWPAAIYTVDDIEHSEYKVPVNKGKESMPYLTYIIDHYDDLKDVTVFLHAHRKARHNDAPGLDTVKGLRYLRIETVLQRGYVNLRCKWKPGCPDEVQPLRGEHDLEGYGGQTEAVYADAWRAFFGNDVPVPEAVGVACCAQFAVTRKSIRRRSREDYIKYRQWLLDTPLEDEVSGRVLEYTWHVFMGEIDEYSEAV